MHNASKNSLNIERQQTQMQKRNETTDSPRQTEQLEKEADPDNSQKQLEENEVNQLPNMCFQPQ